MATGIPREEDLRADTHVVLVSGQPVPNLTPALDPAVAPRRMVLVVSPGMEQRSQWLEAVLRPRGIAVEHWKVADPWDLEHLRERFLELLEREDGASRIALNATGGTKLMSIAGYEVFRDLDLPIFYIHPEQDRMIWLHPPGRPAHELADRIRLKDFLQAHGAQVRALQDNVPDPARLELAEGLVRELHRFRDALATLNWLAGSAERSGTSEPVPDRGPALDELIDRFAEAGVVSRLGDRLRFPDEEARFFVNGGWIEAYVFDQVRGLRKEDARIQDVAYAVEVERSVRGKPVRNELDVALLRDNRLHIIECKTKRFPEAGEDSAGAEALYKLDTLRDLMGGLQARAMLVSFQGLKESHRRRAADLRIEVCAGGELQALKGRLRSFLGG